MGATMPTFSPMIAFLIELVLQHLAYFIGGFLLPGILYSIVGPIDFPSSFG
jgi:hypothetical protein